MTDWTAEQALTDHVALILDDDALYLQRREIVQSTMRAQLANAQVSRVADALKAWCEELAMGEDPPADLATEILTTALAFVDWRSLAADYIAEESA